MSRISTDARRAAETLRGGGLVAFPTETVYGLGADARNAAAVRRIFEAKGRPATNPLIVHVADVGEAKRYAGAWPGEAEALAARFWPGALTMVLPRAGGIVDEVTAGLSTVGLRVPNHPLALEMLRASGVPVAGPSANRSNRVSPVEARHVEEELGDRVDMILDGGRCGVGIESTVLELAGGRRRILRPGGVAREEIEAVIGPVGVGHYVAKGEAAAASPGQGEVHYSPRTPAYRFERGEAVEVGEGDEVMGWGERAGVTMPSSAVEYARELYRVLRELDGRGYRRILVEMPPAGAEWLAVRDRLMRATRRLR